VPSGVHRRRGCPRAQPEERHRRAAARCAGGHHGPERVGQVLARVRHDLRGGAAALRRVAERLRAPVPGADGQAGRRLDRGALPGDLDRPEDDLAQPALHGRHGHGDLRLPAPPVVADRAAALLQLRARDRRPVGGADHRPDHGVRGRDAVHGPRADRARAQGRVRQAVRGAARRGLHAREGRRRAAAPRGGHRPRQEVQARHLRRGGPPRHAARPPQAPRRLRGDRGGARRGDHRDRDGPAGRRGARAADVLRALRVPALRDLDARARAADVLLQLAARRVPALHRPGHADGDRPGPRGPGRGDDPRGGRGAAVVERGIGLLRADHPGDRRPLRGRSRDGVGRPAAGRPGPVPVRDGRRPDLRLLPQPHGAPALVHDRLRGDHPQPRAPLPGDGLRLVAREDRGVHERPAVPGVQGLAPAAREPGGHRERHGDPRVHAPERPAGARVARVARPERARPRDRAAHPARDRRAAAVPRERRRRIPVDGAGGVDAERRRGAADPPRDADRVVARRRPLHPRRAVDRAAPARQRAADRDARAPARSRQHGARGRARRGHDAGRRLPARHGPGGGRARRPRGRGGHRRRGHAGRGVAHGPVPGGHPADRDPREAADPERLRRDRGRRAAQPQEGRREDPARRLHRGDRGERLGQVHARQRDPLQGGRQPAAPGEDAPGDAQAAARARRARQDHQRRPGPDRAHAALEPRDVHRAVRPDPRAVLQDPGGAGARLQARPLLVQRQGRALRGVPRRRSDQDRDALPAGRLRAVRAVPRQAVQQGDARRPLQGPDDLRRPRHAGRGGARVLRAHPEDRAAAPGAARRRARLHAPRPAGHDAVGRRGAAGQARRGALEGRDGADPLHPRRADDRPALRGHPAAADGARAARGRGQLRGGHRAQHRRHQDRRPHRGHGSRGRGGGRPADRERDAGGGRRGRGLLHGAVPRRARDAQGPPGEAAASARQGARRGV
ncbi:MAG: Excinuclease ABC subunit A, partial [uncultured Solirubrobacteraceae bacterium]